MTVSEPVVALPTFDALSTYVRTALCGADALDPAQTPFYRTPLKRGDKPWGVLFHVEGPRRLKTSAVWADDRIAFYDAVGRQTKSVRLSEAPELSEP